MLPEREARFEALVYTDNPGLAARCAKSFAEFPVDWVMFYQSSLALDYLSRERFDYVIVDVDSEDKGSVLLSTLRSGAKRHSVILAMTSGPVNPSLLEVCYASRVFYPVRPDQLQERLFSTMPLADRLAVEHSAVDRSPASVENQEVESEEDFDTEPSAIARASSFSLRVATSLLRSIGSVLGMKHSLGILAQERVASLLASAGSVWFVQEITRNFIGIEHIAPPSPGPSSLMALGLLLWLCAKHRRISNPQGATILVSARG